MTRRYDTYGFTGRPLESLACHLQQVLGVTFSERDSGYYAGTYYLYTESYGREMRLYANHDSERDSWVREQYREHDVILAVSDLDDMDAIRVKLLDESIGAALLSSTELPSPAE
jgi:hypothetical protein